jgi:hypothetical protein
VEKEQGGPRAGLHERASMSVDLDELKLWQVAHRHSSVEDFRDSTRSLLSDLVRLAL